MPSVMTRELRDGSRRYYVRLRDPVRKKNTSETFTTKREAQKFCDEVAVLGPAEAIARRVARMGSTGATATVDELFDGYIAWKTTRVRSDRTVADYRRDYDNWIRPTFGAREADSITEGAIQAWVEEMVPKLSPKSVVDRHSILHGVFAWAVRTKATLFNPCTGTDLPKRRKTPPKGLRPAEWKALHIALTQIDTDAADLALFLAWTGWRFSEACALSSYDVEDYGDTLYVTMSRVVRRNAAGEHKIVEDGKSEDSLRRIQLSGDAATMIRRRLEAVAAGELVFTTKSGAQWHHSNFLNRAWKPAVKAAALARNPTPHWLRHSHVVWLSMTHEVSLEEIQKRIGHEHIETTMGVYGRMISDVSPAALTALDKLIGADTPVASIES